jgi:hypothetical protein
VRIYVAGPYTPSEAGSEEVREQERVANIARADEMARELLHLGHTPFVPHTMMRGWEDTKGVSREQAERVCFEWVGQCDALLYLGASPGADKERAVAVALKLPIFTPTDLPSAENIKPKHTEAMREGYLREYSECAESYRHTYSTMWQAGAVFTAISAGVLAVWAQGEGAISANTWMLALLPTVFWYQAIFRPMNRYGEARRTRLAAIERRLCTLVPGLNMEHFSSATINSPPLTLGNLILRPRVYWYVTLVGFLLTMIELIYWPPALLMASVARNLAASGD